ncbi:MULTISPECIES: hypothetical protein [Nocardiaceae]|jgi:hypothetical protein|uniref:hypothetical protein n=1 Tax=Nocardiaceae TaxID=85025 RepID=UPI000692334E|nr:MULTISPECIES: hypothetical protein [Rhodococcus]MDJ0004647.1 hypothetical protein [Rhodococcus fascians]MDJ0428818.1 hypothetical protein [Rhodococcus fascians]MDQ0281158.1 hypothetical protein [Rhodococcus fascians]
MYIRPEHIRIDVPSYFDHPSQCHILATTPTRSPALWTQFLDGAEESYRRHDVTPALEISTIRDGGTTALFFAALDRTGTILGGVRVQGPYSSADQSHALVEFAAHPEGRHRVRAMLDSRIEDGVVEIKSAWVAPGAPRGRAVTTMIAQSPAYSTALLGARYALATAASHVRAAWLRTGAAIATHIEPVPYPDDRYRTEVFWWDRTTLAFDAELETWRRMKRNTVSLLAQHGTSKNLHSAVAS